MGNSKSSEQTHECQITLESIYHRILIIGDKNIGKTALIQRFIENTFVNSNDSGISDGKSKQIVVDGTTVTIEVFEVAIQEENKTLRDQCMAKCDGFVLAYSVTNNESLAHIDPVFEEIITAKAASYPPVIVVGTQSDSEERVVTTEQGQQYAKSQGWPFLETSAKNSVNIDELFAEITREISRRKNPVKRVKKG